MSGETADTARAAVPDSGADIGAALLLFPENVTQMELLGDADLVATWRALIAWLKDGEWTPPAGKPARRVFMEVAAKHAAKVAEYRTTKTKRRRAAVSRWKEKAKNASAIQMESISNAHGMLPIPIPIPIPNRTDTIPNLTKPKTKTESESESDTRTEKGVQGEIGSGSETESETESVEISARGIAERVAATGRLKADPWRMPGDEIRHGSISAATILRLAFGGGGWRKAVAQAGEEAVRELFLTFRSEMRAGEMPKNPAAAFTERLRNDLGVDFAETRQGGSAEREGRDAIRDFAAHIDVHAADKAKPDMEARRREMLAKLEAWKKAEGVA